MQGQQEYELVVLIFARLDLLKHCLGFLKQDKALFETFLRNEVDGRLIELIDDDRHLV